MQIKKALPFVVLVLLALGLAYFFRGAKMQTEVHSPVTPTPVESSTAKPTPTEAPLPELPKAVASLPAADQQKLNTLQEILRTHNDNDPRIDTELAQLSPEAKKAMAHYYTQIPGEKRNDRGTIVFLLGRSVREKADVDFLKSVLMEKPCLSLQNCNQLPEQTSGEDEHLEGINETTANYPQLNAVRAMISQYRELMGLNPPNRALAENLISALQEATRSPNERVVSEAENALRYLGR